MYFISFVMSKSICRGEYCYSNMQAINSMIAIDLGFQILRGKLAK